MASAPEGPRMKWEVARNHPPVSLFIWSCLYESGVRLRRGSETRLDSPYPFVRRGVTRQDTLHANCLTARSLLTRLTTGADAGP